MHFWVLLHGFHEASNTFILGKSHCRSLRLSFIKVPVPLHFSKSLFSTFASCALCCIMCDSCCCARWYTWPPSFVVGKRTLYHHSIEIVITFHSSSSSYRFLVSWHCDRSHAIHFNFIRLQIPFRVAHTFAPWKV